MSLGIRHIAYHVPDGVLTNDTLVERHGFDEAFIKNKLGIDTRHIAAAEESTSDLAVAAGQKVLAECNIDPATVDCLVVVTQTPDYVLPHTAALVQERMGIPTSAASFDLSLGCSGYVYGLTVALSFMSAQGLTNGLLITAEQYSKLLDQADRATAPLFGDGAAATVLGDSPIYTLGKATFGTDGTGASALIAKGTGTRDGQKQPLFMDGREIFNFMMTRVPESVDACLAQNGLKKEEIDLWVFHQASRYMITMLAKRLGIDMTKVVIEMDDIGNTTSSTIPIALNRYLGKSESRPKNILISGFGVGLSWASAVLYQVEQ